MDYMGRHQPDPKGLIEEEILLLMAVSRGIRQGSVDPWLLSMLCPR